MSRARSLFTAAFTLACALGCGAGAPEGEVESWSGSAPSAPHAEEIGSLSLALSLGNLDFDAFSYAITGPNFTKAGSIDVSNSSTVSILIDKIPAGSGYSITLTGTSAAPDAATCSGSASFDVTAGETTGVSVAVTCHLPDPEPVDVPKVPLPPLTPLALGLAFLALGGRAASRRSRSSG